VLVILEGIDRVGKTTLANMLVKQGFMYLKDEFLVSTCDDFKSSLSFCDYSLGKCDSTVVLLLQLIEQGHDIVMDRLHLTEMVYGTIERKGSKTPELFMLDRILSMKKTLLVMVEPDDINYSNEHAGCDLTEHAKLMALEYSLSCIWKVKTKFKMLASTCEQIMMAANDYDLYFASPFFNKTQIEREERMIDHLRKLGLTVFSPKESCNLDAKSTASSREKVFSSNCDAIRKSRAVFAITDEKDMGTIWEAGFAYGIKKPVMYYAETLGDNQFNLMLAESGRDVFTKQSEVTIESIRVAIRDGGRKYKGDIE